MKSINHGDLASFGRNLRLTTQVRREMENLTYEVASGMKSDLAKAVSGDFTPLASIERSLRTLGAYQTSIKEAGLFVTGMQQSFEVMALHTSEMGSKLLTAATIGDATTISVTAKDARVRMDAVVSALNTRMGGRSLFGGTATGQTPLISAQEMLDDIRIAMGTPATADDVVTALDTWFDDPGGAFETTAYLGETDFLSPFGLSEQESTRLEITASDPSVRTMLKGFAMAALIEEGALTDVTEQAALMRKSGEMIMGAESGLADMRAQVGTVEAQIEEARVSNATRMFAYESAKAEIVSADIYESASRLSQTESQLEMVYTLTARLSRLKLTDFL